jgi:Holliday junction resolvase RusA-like endonuclease
MYKTSWSDNHLKQLKDITNHKVIYDGYEFVWMSKLDGNWNRHYVRNFTNYNKPMSWIHVSIYKWNKEYKNRYSNYLENMRRSLEIDIRIQEISRVANIKTKQKIQEILNLKPDINNKDISDILGVTIRTVERHRK